MASETQLLNKITSLTYIYTFFSFITEIIVWKLQFVISQVTLVGH